MRRAIFLLAGAALAGTAAVRAAPDADGFPEGATPVTPEAITQAVAGKSFPATDSSGHAYSIEYKADGSVLTNRRGRSDSGKWHAEGSTLCFEWKKSPNGCGELRESGGKLYYKRYTDGRVGAMTPE